MGAGLLAEDLGFESPLCQQPTHKIARRHRDTPTTEVSHGKNKHPNLLTS